MLDATIGMPWYFVPVCRNVNSREMSTSDRVPSVERFGRMSTSRKSSLTPSSIRIRPPVLSAIPIVQAGDALPARRGVDRHRIDVRDEEPAHRELQASVARFAGGKRQRQLAVRLGDGRKLVRARLAVDAEPRVG